MNAEPGNVEHGLVALRCMTAKHAKNIRMNCLSQTYRLKGKEAGKASQASGNRLRFEFFRKAQQALVSGGKTLAELAVDGL